MVNASLNLASIVGIVLFSDGLASLFWNKDAKSKDDFPISGIACING
tara:strand:+ start:696 stop:836 length:141 start_codon:yes stop_codon:yes gene_type:complete